MTSTLNWQLLFGFFLFLSFQVMGQELPDRYRTFVFDSVEEASSVLFSEDVPQPVPNGGFLEGLAGSLPINVREYETTLEDLYMDIFEPYGDTLKTRPAIVLCFGGGFVDGERTEISMRLLADSLARLGFVTATIDYRLGMNVFDADLGARAVYRGIQDSRAAVKFLRANASVYQIDTNQVFIGGHSAGAFIALHNLYLDAEAERPTSTFGGIQSSQSYDDLGTLDATGIASGVSGKANGLFSLAGAIGDTSYIVSSDSVGALLFHSSDDDVVPYGFGMPFSNQPAFVLALLDLPNVYGSSLIEMQLSDLQKPVEFNSYNDRGHSVHLTPGSTLYDDIVDSIGSWFYEQNLKPADGNLIGATEFCALSSVQTYEFDHSVPYYDWQVVGGEILNPSTSNEILSVMWYDTAMTNSISVTPYSQTRAKGLTKTIVVSQVTPAVNTWTGGTGMWEDVNQWTLGRLPIPCDSVVLSGIGVNVLVNDTSQIRALNLSEGAILRLNNGARVEVAQE